MKNWICVAALSAALGSCTSANERVLPANVGKTTAIATTGNLRLVTERNRTGTSVVCSEPSPDYAIAFDKTAKATIRVTDRTATTTEASPEVTTDEAIDEGAGRAQAVLALRDGLYAACQSYANGLIGQDAYSIILSQYGNLLVALTGRSTIDDKGNVVATPTGPINPRQATMQALVVACISGSDPTRIPSVRNMLLDEKFCRTVLYRALQVSSQG